MVVVLMMHVATHVETLSCSGWFQSVVRPQGHGRSSSRTEEKSVISSWATLKVRRRQTWDKLRKMQGCSGGHACFEGQMVRRIMIRATSLVPSVVHISGGEFHTVARNLGALGWLRRRLSNYCGLTALGALRRLDAEEWGPQGSFTWRHSRRTISRTEDISWSSFSKDHGWRVVRRSMVPKAGAKTFSANVQNGQKLKKNGNIALRVQIWSTRCTMWGGLMNLAHTDQLNLWSFQWNSIKLGSEKPKQLSGEKWRSVTGY